VSASDALKTLKIIANPFSFSKRSTTELLVVSSLIILQYYSNWPTYPQLYVNGEFVGGHDIVVGYYKEGKLAEVLKTNSKQ
jgi:glutaredoxin-related protein